MAAAYARHGMADRPATFSLFVRELPAGRGSLVAADLDDALVWLGARPLERHRSGHHPPPRGP